MIGAILLSAALVGGDVSAPRNDVVCEWTDEEIAAGKIKCDITPTNTQVFELKLDSPTNEFGNVEWYWEGETKRGEKDIRWFEFTNIGKPHTYRVRPNWRNDGKKVRELRLKLRCSKSPKPIVKSFKIVETAIPEPIDTKKAKCISFGYKSTKVGRCRFRWLPANSGVIHQVHFRVPADDVLRAYSIDLSKQPGWSGKVVWYEFCDCNYYPIKVKGLQFGESLRPIKPQAAIMSARVNDALIREGQEVPVEVVVFNQGTKPLNGVKVEAVDLPEGARVSTPSWSAISNGTITAGNVDMFTVGISGLKAGKHELGFKVLADEGEAVPTKVEVAVLPSLNLAKVQYVPEPQPVMSDYDIGAFYFPGWTPAFRKGEAWKAIWHVCPERKPMLGWYDEGNPEAIDWHIKWLRENGISWLMVDWYWTKGRRILEHFVKGLEKARYRGYIKWALHWCNHNEKGSHTEEDCRAVVKYWLENCFNQPEYYRIDDKPVVMIYSAEGIVRDMGEEGCQKFLTMAREEAMKAGYKGIYFIAMKWAERDIYDSLIKKYARYGFDATSIYHYREHDGNVPDLERYSFQSVVNSNLAHWEKWRATGILPYLPHISTGWDSRPWQESKECYGKSVTGFRQICEEAKAFADKHGLKRFVLSPLNEWGEGSYAEPNGEFGFSFYEAVREIFCKRPDKGWPLNYTPRDVGLGPYRFPRPYSN